MSSYRDAPYPADLDWAAVRDTLKIGDDFKLGTKALAHCGLYTLGLVVGEPDSAPRLGLSAPLEVDWSQVDEAEPYTAIEAEQRMAEPQAIFGPVGEAIAVLRLLKTIKDHAPELFAFVKAAIEKARGR